MRWRGSTVRPHCIRRSPRSNRCGATVRWRSCRASAIPSPNLSHFRSIEIWDTASDSQQFLQTGWLTRTVDKQSAFAALSADGVVIGAADLGPLAGGARAVALNDPARFARQARLASADGVRGARRAGACVARRE